MTQFTEVVLRELRQRYQAAYEAYQSCVQALAEIERKGEMPSEELLTKESHALHELNEARDRYRDALIWLAGHECISDQAVAAWVAVARVRTNEFFGRPVREQVTHTRRLRAAPPFL